MRRTSVFAALAFAISCAAAHAAKVQYFTLPSGAGPHDVAVAADGTVWYTGQRDCASSTWRAISSSAMPG